MKHELIKTENYLLVVNDEQDIEENMFTLKNGEIRQVSYLGQDNGNAIIAHLPLNGAPYLDGVDVLPEIENRSNSDLYYHKQVMNPYGTGEQSYTAYEKGFIDGYNKAKETYKYTEEDLRKAFTAGLMNRYSRVGEAVAETEFVQSLNQPKLPIAFESDEYGIGNDENGRPVIEPRTITTLRGTEWVGKYLF